MATSSSTTSSVSVKQCLCCGETMPFLRGMEPHEYRRKRYCSHGCAAKGGYQHRPLRERIMGHIEKSPGGCWSWTGSRTAAGYGRLSVNGKERYAHRLCFELFTGNAIPYGAVLCHHCDNPSCVNPAHLFVGTQADNLLDMRRKGRGSNGRFSGTDHHQAKIQDADVVAIRASSSSQRAIARQYGLAQSTVWAIRARRLWAHIP